MKRVPPSAKTREDLRGLLSDGGSEGPKSALVRLGARLMVREALEAALRGLLGRNYYERRGIREGRLKTTEGEVRYASPQVRGVEASSLARLRKLLPGRTESSEELALQMYARGCSTRDVEAIFRDEEGRSLVSRTAVSEITEALWSKYEEFATRDLSEIRPLYLYLDGIAERLRPGAKREAILCAWCITWEGKKVLIHVSPGAKESTECCRDFLAELKRRGLTDPLLYLTDGAAGLIRACEEVLTKSARQRCLAHRTRNISAKVPENLRVEFLQAARAAYQLPSKAMAKTLRKDLVARYEKQCPSAVRCFEEDFEACVAHLDCPPAHGRIVRATNLLERLFGEERRRTKAAPTMFGERPMLKMMYASLIRASDSWRGIGINDSERKQLERLRDQLVARHTEGHAPAMKNSSNPKRFSSENRT